MHFLKTAGAGLGAVVFLIAALALGAGYEEARTLAPRAARVLDVRDSIIRYELQEPGSEWDKDGDGWIGPYVDDDVPEWARAELRPGDPLVARGSRLELGLSPPSPLLWVGMILCLLAAGWFSVEPILERRSLARARGDASRLIELMARKTRRTKIVSALTLLALGASVGAVALMIAETAGERGFLGGLGALTIGYAFWLGAAAWRLRDLANIPVVKLMREAPERAVWIYPERASVNGIPLHFAFVCCDDGSKHGLNPPSQSSGDLRPRLSLARSGGSELQTQGSLHPARALQSENGDYVNSASAWEVAGGHHAWTKRGLCFLSTGGQGGRCASGRPGRKLWRLYGPGRRDRHPE